MAVNLFDEEMVWLFERAGYSMASTAASTRSNFLVSKLVAFRGTGQLITVG